MTVMDCMVTGPEEPAAVMARDAVAEIDPDVALIVVEPAATPVATPEAAIVAMLVVLEDQVTDVVRFLVEPSLYVPVAVNCWVAPTEIDAEAGVTEMEVRVAVGVEEPSVTVSCELPDTPSSWALIVLVPADTAVA